MDRSDIEDDPEEGEINNDGEKEPAVYPNHLSQMDFYQADPFAHCQSDRMYQANMEPRHCKVDKTFHLMTW